MFFKVIIYLLFSLLCFTTYATLPKEVTVCSDGNEWPPFAFYKRDKNNKKTSQIIGYTVDMMNNIFTKNKIKLNFFLEPWGDCLLKVKNNNKFMIAMDASYSPERNKNYLLSYPYYALNPRVFYLKKNFPKGLGKFKNYEELKKVGTICGIKSYNYEMFIDGLKNRYLESSAKNYNELVNKLHKGECKVFLARYEIIEGFKKLGGDFKIGKDVKSEAILDSGREKFYMLLSRKLEFKDELRKMINKGILELKFDKTLDKYLKKYLNKEQ